MNVSVLLGALQYEQEVEQTIKVVGDIVQGKVGTTPELTQVVFRDKGKTYHLTLIAQEVADIANAGVATEAAGVDVGAVVDQQ